MKFPPLTPLHPEASLVQSKLEFFERQSSEQIKQTLQPGQKDCLKARPDGTMLDGHHRTAILRLRGVDVDVLPREIIAKEQE
jgi:ParB-like chromosome segregation protein Spo0J